MKASPGTSDHVQHADALLRDLSCKILQHPHCLTQALCHGFVHPISISRHLHKDFLQLDFNYGYSGYAIINGETIGIRNITALAMYPGELHELVLEPVQRDAKVFSVKIQVEPGWAAVKRRLFERCVYRPIADYRLLRALTRLVRLSMLPTCPLSLQCVYLAEVLCYWPTPDQDDYRCEIWNSEEEIGKGMQAVLSYVDDRLKDPPNLEELATVAFMSPRNFVRRFRAAFNCAPHQYVTARRLAWARELLSEGRLNITEIAEEMGFPSIHIFSRWFQRECQISPSEFRKRSELL